MAEFFLELFSEEIPARMQHLAANELQRRCLHGLQFLKPTNVRLFYGARRIAFAATINADDSFGRADTAESLGPRVGAPDAAIDGFLKKHAATRDELIVENGKYLLRRRLPASTARELILEQLPGLLAKLPWPKSMRWGSSGDFTWVRPLRRIICLLEDEIIPLALGPVIASNITEGHRVHGPGPFVVSAVADWEEKLRKHHVIADASERRAKIWTELGAAVAAKGLEIVPDEGLLDEVTGLVEWPKVLVGQIDGQFMDLPPEVRELSMKINQKYFALRDSAGEPAPYFAFVANLNAPDGGAAIIAGNERVLRARLSDARHFWELDQQTSLDELLPKLEKITFHAEISTQRKRADRIAGLAKEIAEQLGADGYQANQAHWAGLLAKADLVTGMVGEFPELQGIMGGYYAVRHYRGWDGPIVGAAIRTHYQPKGPSDAVPTGLIPVSVALADKLDTLIKFFEIGEKPTGSGDPYALRRAALGVIRIILENNLRLPLKTFIAKEDLLGFIMERLRVKLRGEGQRFDILDAVLAAGTDDDLLRIMWRVGAVSSFLSGDDGKNLLAAYKRVANILKIEDAKDGPHAGAPDKATLTAGAETEFYEACHSLAPIIASEIANNRFGEALKYAANTRQFVDAFLINVMVNDPVPEIRQNRLRLLARFRDTANLIADFSKIEG